MHEIVGVNHGFVRGKFMQNVMRIVQRVVTSARGAQRHPQRCKMRHENPRVGGNDEVKGWGQNLPFCFKGK